MCFGMLLAGEAEATIVSRVSRTRPLRGTHVGFTVDAAGATAYA